MTRLDVCAAADLPAGSARVVHSDSVSIGVYNLDGEL